MPQFKIYFFQTIKIPKLNLFCTINTQMITQHQIQTPQKPAQLFHMWANSSSKACRMTATTKSKKAQTFQRSNSSPQKTYNPNQLLSYVSPFNPVLESSSSGEDPKSMTDITDRYIPSRKLLKKESLFQEQQMNENQENGSSSPEGSEFNVSDIYKKYIMSSDSAQKEKHLEIYQNNNILKYSKKNFHNSFQSLLTAKNSKSQFPKNHLHFQEQNFPIKSQKHRKINKLPVKVLDAPALCDDFYLNLLDWSSGNLLAVGLSSSVYIWNGNNSKVVKLLELSASDLVTSNSFTPSSNILGVGTHSGEVQLWDCNKLKKVQTIRGHAGRVGAIAWNSNHILASGSRDKNILLRDTRIGENYINKMTGHKQEICGLKWSFDGQQLASGGNDNRLNLWSMSSSTPTASFMKHTAAVKALAWSPHQHGLLVSGGGTADRTIRFWNTITGTETKCVDAGSQVCNLMFAKTVNELVSTHGYSLNEINIWKTPKMEKIEKLTGHTYRVLYLAMSPDGTTIVTGAGDETLRFWNVFPKTETEHKPKQQLTVDSMSLR